MKEPAHLALHPFGQIPTYEEGDLALFDRARAITWMFAALSTVEPPILELANAKILESDKPWTKKRLPLVEDRVRNRLHQLLSPG